MANNAYPHMIFATDAASLDKDTLGEALGELFPGAHVDYAPLKYVLTVDDYTFTFWYDDDADGLAERYASYLPEGARRRRLSACRTMVDLSGTPDPDGTHRAQAELLVASLADLDDVWVFSEESKRFVGMDYGDAVPAAVAPLVSDPPVPVPYPAAVPEPAPQPTPQPTPPAAVPEPAPQPTPQPTPQHEPSHTVPVAPAVPPAWRSAEEQEGPKGGFFKKAFKRKKD